MSEQQPEEESKLSMRDWIAVGLLLADVIVPYAWGLIHRWPLWLILLAVAICSVLAAYVIGLFSQLGGCVEK